MAVERPSGRACRNSISWLNCGGSMQRAKALAGSQGPYSTRPAAHQPRDSNSRSPQDALMAPQGSRLDLKPEDHSNLPGPAQLYTLCPACPRLCILCPLPRNLAAQSRDSGQIQFNCFNPKASSLDHTQFQCPVASGCVLSGALRPHTHCLPCVWYLEAAERPTLCSPGTSVPLLAWLLLTSA